MPELSIIVPTFNERDNVQEVNARVCAALPGVDWEMIFVDDDSPDDCAGAVRKMGETDPRIRCVHRIGRRGLASACMEGILASCAPVVAVMDADLQHDERLLLLMLDTLLDDKDLDVVVGSRYVEGGHTGSWDASRARLSRLATRLGAIVLKADLKDPMSGFFMIRHAAALRCIRKGMSGVGFKILFDLFASSPEPLRFRELPYEFRNRVAGESKLDSTVAWEYFIMLLDRFLGGIVPIRFIAFAMVGGLGLVVHMAVLGTLFKGLGLSFVVAQTTATLVAMTGNFLLNNVLTYRDLRLRGWRLLTGWASFSLVCSVGALANVGIADWLFVQRPQLWAASAVAGVLVGAVWNYAVSTVYTWKKPRTA
ncbi:glycosyltransferase family 2 protein [Variovorax sp. J22R133]|uniref:glycosyltransferase n=1 Tax=Variovorax brevis TaxID=3053503 RepID=UPI002577981D|nr:glycosyltransferase family 2 protein [Variovorax sp. J22R133]MDM0111375.1 glycosyltransferase family 2 protein [Variovorax sp. J22R133]